MQQPKKWEVQAGKKTRRYRTFERAAEKAASRLVKHGLACIKESGGYAEFTAQTVEGQATLVITGKYTHDQAQALTRAYDQERGRDNGHAA